MASTPLRTGFFCIRYPSNGRNRNLHARAESKDSAKKLRLFIDSANVEDWKKWLPSGVFHGVMTSPVELQKANVACHPKRLANLVADASKMGVEEVQMQTWGKTVDSYLSVGNDLAKISSSVVVKVPATTKGVEAAGKLVKQGARVNLVGIYSLSQILIAVATGVEYATTRLGRLLEIGKNTEDIKKMQEGRPGSRLPSMSTSLTFLVAYMSLVPAACELQETSSGCPFFLSGTVWMGCETQVHSLAIGGRLGSRASSTTGVGMGG